MAVNEEGINQGNYTFQYRYKLLEELLIIQKEIQIERPVFNLISNQELIAIQVIWNRDNFFEKSVSELFNKIYGNDIYSKNFKSISALEKNILKEECQEDISMYKLIENLISVQETKSLLVSNYGLNNDLEKVLESQLDQMIHEN